MITSLKTHSAPSLEPSLLFITRPGSSPNCILVKRFSPETSLIWTVIARSKLIPLVPDWHDVYGVKGEHKHVRT